MLLVFLYLCSTALSVTLTTGENLGAIVCAEDGDCLSDRECKEKCDCNRLYYYNETLEECVLNLEYLKKGLVEKYNAQGYKLSPYKVSSKSYQPVLSYKWYYSDVQNGDAFANNLDKEAAKTFQGILISAMLFGICTIICTLSACIYCCRINYTDGKLKKDVEALAQKLNRDGKSIKPRKASLKPVAESCNIIVEDAGVFVV